MRPAPVASGRCRLRTTQSGAAGTRDRSGRSRSGPQVAGISWYHSIDLGRRDRDSRATRPTSGWSPSGLPELGVRPSSTSARGTATGRSSPRSAAPRGSSRWTTTPGRVDFARPAQVLGALRVEGRSSPTTASTSPSSGDPETMPGRAGFDLARRVTGSSVEPVQADFMTVDPEQSGRFDVVLFLGVLYHVREPLSALERVCGLTSEVAVIETEAIAVLGMPDARLLEFHESGGLRGDYTNWFVPTEAALHALCHAAGFARVVTRIGPPPRSRLLKSGARRLTRRAQTGDRQVGPPQPGLLSPGGDAIPDRGARISAEEMRLSSQSPVSVAAADELGRGGTCRLDDERKILCARGPCRETAPRTAKGAAQRRRSSMAAKKRA